MDALLLMGVALKQLIRPYRDAALSAQRTAGGWLSVS